MPTHDITTCSHYSITVYSNQLKVYIQPFSPLMVKNCIWPLIC